MEPQRVEIDEFTFERPVSRKPPAMLGYHPDLIAHIIIALFLSRGLYSTERPGGFIASVKGRGVRPGLPFSIYSPEARRRFGCFIPIAPRTSTSVPATPIVFRRRFAQR